MDTDGIHIGNLCFQWHGIELGFLIGMIVTAAVTTAIGTHNRAQRKRRERQERARRKIIDDARRVSSRHGP